MTGNALAPRLNFLFQLSIALLSLYTHAERLCDYHIRSVKKEDKASSEADTTLFNMSCNYELLLIFLLPCIGCDF